MVDLVRIAGVAVVASVLIAFLRREAPPFGILAALGFAALVSIFLIEPLGRIIDVLVRLADGANVRSTYLTLVLKAVGIAYIASIASELCRDAGEHGVGAAVELAGKVYILILAVPLVTAILDAMARILP